MRIVALRLNILKLPRLVKPQYFNHISKTCVQWRSKNQPIKQEHQSWIIYFQGLK